MGPPPRLCGLLEEKGHGRGASQLPSHAQAGRAGPGSHASDSQIVLLPPNPKLGLFQCETSKQTGIEEEKNGRGMPSIFTPVGWAVRRAG